MSASGEPKHLVVFATSDSPDPYINSISHCVVHMGIGSVEIVVISEHDYAEQKAAMWATRISSRVNQQLELLMSGDYISYVGPGSPAIETLTHKGADQYAKVLEVLNRGGASAKVVPLNSLYSCLQEWIRLPGGCVFDVTSLKKNLLVDITVALIALDYDEIYAFELKRTPSFGQQDLFHALSSPLDYEYRNLLRSAPVRSALARLRRLTIGTKPFLIAAAGLLAFSISLFFRSPSSKVLAFVGIISAVASIGSALLPFVRRIRE